MKTTSSLKITRAFPSETTLHSIQTRLQAREMNVGIFFVNPYMIENGTFLSGIPFDPKVFIGRYDPIFLIFDPLDPRHPRVAPKVFFVHLNLQKSMIH